MRLGVFYCRIPSVSGLFFSFPSQQGVEKLVYRALRSIQISTSSNLLKL